MVWEKGRHERQGEGSSWQRWSRRGTARYGGTGGSAAYSMTGTGRSRYRRGEKAAKGDGGF